MAARRRIGAQLALKSTEGIEKLRADREPAVLRRELPAHAAQLLVGLRHRVLIQLAAAGLPEPQRGLRRAVQRQAQLHAAAPLAVDLDPRDAQHGRRCRHGGS